MTPLDSARTRAGNGRRIAWRDLVQTAVLLALAAASLGTVCVQGTRILHSGGPRPEAPVPPSRVAEWLELLRAGVRQGPASAPLQVVYFSDFECPACRTLHARLDSLSGRHPGSVAVTVLHFPIESLHPHARAAAVAAECAGDQARFTEFARLLFAAQERIGITAWDAFAWEAGVPDLETFRRCTAGPEAPARVRRHEALAGRLGVTGTPTVIVNALMFDIPPSTAQLDSIAGTVFVQARRLPAPGADIHRITPVEQP